MQHIQAPISKFAAGSLGWAALALFLASAGPANAETYAVTRSDDDVTVNHTLRYAVAHAQDGDTVLLTDAIQFQSPVVLTQGELVVSRSITILSVPSQTPTISGNGGAILNLGTLSVQNCTLSGNFAQAGGAIYSAGTLSVTDSAIKDNTALQDGGGLLNTVDGVAVLGNTAVDNNTSFGNGGASPCRAARPSTAAR
jgi:predicted outer membrane repeat protein